MNIEHLKYFIFSIKNLEHSKINISKKGQK